MSKTNETEINDWHQIDWQKVDAIVTNLRERIYVASRENDLKKVRNLQKLMLRSRANWLQAIRRVTQINKGRRTPGIDREIVTKPKERINLFQWLGTINLYEWQPMPTRRVNIPKGKHKTRPLGIAIIRDRIIQAIVKNALEPYWEARFEMTSYGFRPGRSAHDALENVWLALTKQKYQWILDADIKGAFDHISHQKLMEVIGKFPARALIERWLKAGVMVGLDFIPTDAGTPQGNIISPLLANIALHGMEAALGIKRWKRTNTLTVVGPVRIVRFADDFVAIAITEEEARKAEKVLTEWLNERGLEMSQEKTQIVHIDEGFDFLGFTIKRLKAPMLKKGTGIYLRPSNKSVGRIKDKIRAIFKKGRHKSPRRIIAELNPLITGWTMYFRTGVSSKTFKALDHFMWHQTWRYALRRHPGKGKRWVKAQYYTVHKGWDWTFTDKKRGTILKRFGQTAIVRHVKVKLDASPDDPNLKEYWQKRKAHAKYFPTGKKAQLWKKQKGICPKCNGWLGENGEELNIHHLRGRNEYRLKYLQLLHETCHAQITFGTA